jgi:hypothetical protein
MHLFPLIFLSVFIESNEVQGDALQITTIEDPAVNLFLIVEAKNCA